MKKANPMVKMSSSLWSDSILQLRVELTKAFVESKLLFCEYGVVGSVDYLDFQTEFM